MIKTRLFAFAAGLVLMLGTVAVAQRPARDIAGGRHPNLAAAQRLVEQAWNKINAAQSANEFDMGGHAEKAKKLLDEANNELKKAAEEANHKM